MATRAVSPAAWRRGWAVGGSAAIVAFVLWALSEYNWNFAQFGKQAVAGLGTGAAAAIVGVGLALTYQTTGIFNFAFGSFATFCAYVMWHFVQNWGWPLVPAAVLTIGVAGPLLGVGTERLVFRPLQRRAASTSEKLLATVALFAVFIGIPALVWGGGSQLGAPNLFGGGAVHAGSFLVSYQTIGELGSLIVCAGGITLLMQRTRLGLQMRGVVDRRTLAEMSGVRANRVAAAAWAIGGAFAALAGVLFAPQFTLSPFDFTLVILETFAVVVIARLTNLTLAIAGGLGVGMIQGVANTSGINTALGDAWQGLSTVTPYLFVIALPVFLLVWRDLDELGSESSAIGLVSSALGRRRRRNRLVGPGAIVAAVLVLLGFVLKNGLMTDAQQMLAYTVIFLSIVAITGFSGHITLGQTAFAGAGALLTVRIVNGAFPGLPKMNGIWAMLISAAIVTVCGLAAGYSALRRRGLILGLVTLALALIFYFPVLNNSSLTSGTQFFTRPSIFGVSLVGDRAFYFYELVVLAIALFIASSLRSGRLGRVLGAMRDSEAGATSVGISLRRYKLFIFGVSAFLAAIGGSLYTQQQASFDTTSWTPINALFWFLAVVFCGLSFLSGAALAAILTVVIDNNLAQQAGANGVVIGILTLLTIGFLRGGLVGYFMTTVREGRFLSGTARRLAGAAAGQTGADEPGEQPAYAPSPFARRLLAGVRR